MGACGSYPQAMVDLEQEAEEVKKKTQELRWADCEDDEGKEKERQRRKKRKKQGKRRRQMRNHRV